MQYQFEFNEIYEPIFTTDKRIIDVWGGRSRGGSYFGTDYFLFLITQPQYFRGYFIRQAFNDIRDSLFRDFKDRVEDNPSLSMDDFHIQENEMRILYKPTGNMIMSKGVKKEGQRTAKMKSLAGATHVLIEEADEVAQEDFDQLDLSLRTTKSEKIQVIRVFNPPGRLHWIWRDYNLTDANLKDEHGKEIEGYYIATPKSTSNVMAVWSTYEDNLHNVHPSTIQKLESFKDTNEEYYYTIVKGMISEGMKGKIFKGWKTITDAEFNALPYRSVYSLDFGFSQDPAALCEYKKHNQNIWGRELFYTQGLTNLDIAKKFVDFGITKDDIIVADSAEAKSIMELRRGWPDIQLEGYEALRDGFNIKPASKGKGSVAAGITRVKEHTIHFTEGSKNAWVEYGSYCWALDKEKNPTNEPIDAFNHIMDNLRYYATTYVIFGV